MTRAGGAGNPNGFDGDPDTESPTILARATATNRGTSYTAAVAFAGSLIEIAGTAVYSSYGGRVTSVGTIAGNSGAAIRMDGTIDNERAAGSAI